MSTAKFDRDFLYRFPYFPEEQCTVQLLKTIRSTDTSEWAHKKEDD
jgi:hypothetical protein